MQQLSNVSIQWKGSGKTFQRETEQNCLVSEQGLECTCRVPTTGNLRSRQQELQHPWGTTGVPCLLLCWLFCQKCCRSSSWCARALPPWVGSIPCQTVVVLFDDVEASSRELEAQPSFGFSFSLALQWFQRLPQSKTILRSKQRVISSLPRRDLRLELIHLWSGCRTTKGG